MTAGVALAVIFVPHPARLFHLFCEHLRDTIQQGSDELHAWSRMSELPPMPVDILVM